MSDSRSNSTPQNNKPEEKHSLDIFGHYQQNINNGHEKIPAFVGAVGGGLAQGAAQLGVFKTVPKVLSGGAVKGVTGSAGMSYAFQHVNDAGQATSEAIADGVEKVANSGIHFTFTDDSKREFTAHLSKNAAPLPAARMSASSSSSLDQFCDYSTSITRGAYKALKSALNMAIHPLDEVVYPAARLIHDGMVISAKNGWAIDPISGSSLQELNAAITQSPKIYRNAKQRMDERIEQLKMIAPTLVNASGPERAEMLTEMAIGALIPGYIVKGTKTLANLHHYGVPNPPKFVLNEGPDKLPRLKTFTNLSAQDIRKIPGEEGYVYVIKGKKLIISDKESLHHFDLAKYGDTHAAGNMFTKDGIITRIDNQSGGYQPQGKHLETLVNKVFKKNGFHEAPGKFVDISKDIDEVLSALLPGKEYARIELRKSAFTPSSSGTLAGMLDQITRDVRQNYDSTESKAKKSSSESSKPRLNSASTDVFLDEINQRLTPGDKRVAEFLMAYGCEPSEVAEIFQTPTALNMSQEAVNEYDLHQKELETAQTKANCLAFFHGMNTIFTAFSQCSNPTLRKVGAIGAPLMMGAAHLETLTGVFSGGAGSLTTVGFWGSFGAIAGFIGVGISLMSMLLSGDDDDQLMLALQEVHRHIDTVRHEMHERFDRVEHAIVGVANLITGYCNQIIQNQKALFEQNRKQIEIALRGFSTMTALVTDFRAESKSAHDKIFKQFSYLIGLLEAEPLQRLRESIQKKIDIITEASTTETTFKFELLKELISLGSELKKCASSDYNGRKEYALLRHDPAQSAKFLAQRQEHHDDGLGFLAAVVESIDEKEFKEAKIDKDKLPVTALWTKTVDQYFTLSRMPVFAEYKSDTIPNEIIGQLDNLKRFLNYIKNGNVVKKLLTRHKEYLSDFEQALYKAFIRQQRDKPGIGIKDRNEEEARAKILTVGEYCSSGAAKAAVEDILNSIDYNYLILNRLVYLGGYSAAFQLEIAQLDCSITIAKQKFNFNEMAISAPGSTLNDESMVAASKGCHDTPYQNSHLETIGAHFYDVNGEKQLIFLGSSCYPEDQPGAANSCSFIINRYDLTKKIYNQISWINSSVTPTKPIPVVKYKGKFNTTDINHTWASSHIVNNKLVLYTGGSGYVVTFDLRTGKSELIDTSNLVDESKKNALTFSVPLPKICYIDYQLTALLEKTFTTCHTHVLHDRYLHMTKLRWQVSGFGNPEVEFYAIDLEEKSKRPLHSYEVKKLFTNWDWTATTLKCPSEHMPICPNQFFMKTVRPVGKNEALVYGFVQSTHPYKTILRITNEDQLPENLATDTLAIMLNNEPHPFKVLKVFWNTGHKLESKTINASANYLQEIIQALPEMIWEGFTLPCNNLSLASKIVLAYQIPQSRISASFYYKPIVNKGDAPISFVGMNEPSYGVYHFPITAKTVHQTSSQVLHVNGENKLYISTSITDEEGHSKLVILSADFFATPRSLIEPTVFNIPKLHDISNWQAMRTVVVKIGKQDHLIITLLNPDYKMLIFTYDPVLKKLDQLMDGPQLQFVDYTRDQHLWTQISNRGFRGWDRHFSRTRNKYPGNFPVNSLEIRASDISGINPETKETYRTQTLHIAYPTLSSPSATSFEIRVASIPLSPVLTLKPIPTVPAQTVSLSTEPVLLNVPSNHLGMTIARIEILLAQRNITLPNKEEPQVETKTNGARSTQSSAAENKTELPPNEDILNSAISSCKNIYELLAERVEDFKLSGETRASVKDKLQSIAKSYAELTAKSNSLQKKSWLKINEVYKQINAADGLLRFSAKYISEIGSTVDRQLDKLKEELKDIKKIVNKPKRAKTPLVANSLFETESMASSTANAKIKKATLPQRRFLST